MTFDIGDIVVVSFAHVEQARMVKRPALVVAIPPATPAGQLLWVLMITNALRQDWPGDVPIPDAPARGLIVASKVRTSKVGTVVAAEARRLGSLDKASLTAVSNHLRAATASILTG